MDTNAGVAMFARATRFAIALVLLPVAVSAGPRYTKKETDVKAVQTERTDPKRAGGKSEKIGPTLKQEQFLTAVQNKIADINEAMIAKMQKLVAITPDTDPEKPDFYFRLAELYNEKRQYFNFRARTLDEKIYQAANDADKQRLTRDQANNEREEKKWLLEAAKTYLAVANNPRFSTYEKMDEVLFYLAYMLQQVKRNDEARVFFLKLVKDYPQSRFVPDAYLSFGDFYFDAGDMDAAMKFYDKVTKFPQAKVFGYALYKKGWAFYNLKDFKSSMETFIHVIQLAEQGKLDRAATAGLAKECKKDSVLVYSMIGTPEKAWPFFSRIGGDYAPKMEERLADLYYDQGKFTESVKVYHELMRLFPDSAKLCDWEYNVVKNTLSVGQKRDQVQEMQRLSAVYDKFGKHGQAAAKESDIEECKNNTADTLRELATVWHKEAQKTQNPETYALAQYIYREYIDKFPKEKDAYTMNWYYGELLFKLGEQERDTAKQRWYWEKAAEQYVRVAKMNPNGQYVKEAAYAAVISYQNANAAAPDRIEPHTAAVPATTGCDHAADQAPPKPGSRKPGKPAKENCPDQLDLSKQYQPQAIPPDKQKMLEAFDTYLGLVHASDADDQMIRIKYQRARIYYEYNHFDKAIPLFADIADHNSKHELGVIAGNLLLDSLRIMGKYDAVAKFADRFLQNPDLMKDQEFAATLRRIKSETRWAAADRLRTQRKYKDAARMYVEIFNDAPDSPRAPQTLYNAGINYEAARLVGRAIEVRKKLIEFKPDSPEAKKALYMIGENYHGLAYYNRAAENYEQYASKYPGEKEAADALANATFFRTGLGDDQKAIDDNNLYIKFYGQRKPTEAAEVFFKIGAIYEKERKWDQLLKHLQEFITKYGSKAPHLMVVAHVKMGELLWRQSCPIEGVNGACIKVERVRAGGAASVMKSRGKKLRIKNKTQCGSDTAAKITYIKRNDAKAKEAQKHYATALSLYKTYLHSVPGENEQERAQRADLMGYYAAQARFTQAEEVYEKLLAIPFPQGLVFDPKLKKKNEESKKKFEGWLKDKQKVLEAAQKIYQDVLNFKQAHWSIASAARIGQLFQNFADGLFTAPIPPPSELVATLSKAGYKKADIQDAVDTFKDAYCDALQDKADPLEAKAEEALGKCLQKSTELSWFNEWSNLCETELNQIKPSEYPLASELRAEPGYVSSQVDDGILVEDIE
jgi:tetratricopeptide (TPR) repeat protein